MIDGLWTDNVRDFNPADAESVQVLKDAASLAAYGSRGANGVVIITTRKGRSGQPSITFNGDPTTGTWIEKGQIAVPNQDLWAIDATILEQNNKRYLLWSGQEAGSVEQRLYIAPMSNPWTISGPRAELSRPEYPWERNGDPKVNEGPQVLKRNNRTFIVYSASHCSTDDYALGMLSTSNTADPMIATSWTKSATPVFTKDPADRAYGPGHNSFFKSKNGQEDWILYHANSGPNQGCGDARSPRMQKLIWNADDMPNFGTPEPIGVQLPEPGGE